MTTNGYYEDQLVKGIKAGHFVILAFRTMPGSDEVHAQLKEINPTTLKTGRGEIALPLSAIKPL